MSVRTASGQALPGWLRFDAATFVLNRGDGSDTIAQNNSAWDDVDVALFGPGILADQLWLRRAGHNLEVSVIGTADKFILQNWYLGSQHHVEQLRTSDGSVLLDSQVHNLVQAMAAFSPPAPGQTTLAPGYQNALGMVIAANWQ